MYHGVQFLPVAIVEWVLASLASLVRRKKRRKAHMSM
jgi:hypothetical protein